VNRNVKIRREKPGDAPSVRRVNELAFGQPKEAKLVDALRAAGAVVVSLVAVEGDVVVGHILFSPVTLESETAGFSVVGLGTLAVLPGRQKTGIGSMLVNAGLAELRRANHDAVVVVGHPSYYPRFGFVRASAHNIRSEIDVPDEAFMVMELKPGALAGRAGVVQYRPEFTAF
jgi:putative acetyltransferase